MYIVKQLPFKICCVVCAAIITGEIQPMLTTLSKKLQKNSLNEKVGSMKKLV